MSMPKGFKSTHGYATVKDYDGGSDYRTIAEKMSAAGYKMNHATARNVFPVPAAPIPNVIVFLFIVLMKFF